MARKTSNSSKRSSGTLRRSRKRPDREPTEAIMMPPGDLPDAAKAIWRRKAPALAAEGLLEPLDVENFAVWCALQARIDERIREGKDLGRDLLLNYRALSNYFGLNPDARSKLGFVPEKPEKPDNPFYMMQRRS